MFGFCQNVHFKMAGPCFSLSSTEGEEPRHILGDIDNNANGRELSLGTYTVAAVADNDGDLSRSFEKNLPSD